MARISYAIRNFVGAAGVFAAAFLVAESGIYTMICLGVSVFIAGIFSFGIRNDQDGKRYGPYMLLYGGILAAAGIICRVFEVDFWLLKYVGAVALVLCGYFQWIKIGSVFGTTKALRRIEVLAIIGFPILITAGVVLSVFTAKIALGKGLIIIGAVIWIIHTVYALILMNEDAEPDISKFNFDARKSTYNFDKNKILDENDVMQVVRMVAKRFEDGRVSLPHGASVTIYVYDEVDGSSINYKMSGNLHDTLLLSDGQKSEVQVALIEKLKQRQEGLIKATQRELLKYKGLPYASYNITTEIGLFDE